ncbi:MAG: TlpA family protein disulfide reductase [Verrucomicrobiales bacterium]|nr:TlpA family protein disulfide reductase [Verrucomicrobiales bacterium]
MSILSNKPSRFFPTLVRSLTLTLVLAAVAGAAPKVGDPFPDLQSYGLEGALPDLKGKVVLVDFFASWCEPCKASFPVMQALHKDYAAKGLVILAVNVDEKAADMAQFLKKHTADFAVVRDAQHKLVSEIKIKAMPSSFLVDAQGKVVAVHSGFKGEETRKKYVSEIEALLNSK